MNGSVAKMSPTQQFAARRRHNRIRNPEACLHVRRKELLDSLKASDWIKHCSVLL